MPPRKPRNYQPSERARNFFNPQPPKAPVISNVVLRPHPARKGFWKRVGLATVGTALIGGAVAGGVKYWKAKTSPDRWVQGKPPLVQPFNPKKSPKIKQPPAVKPEPPAEKKQPVNLPPGKIAKAVPPEKKQEARQSTAARKLAVSIKVVANKEFSHKDAAGLPSGLKVYRKGLSGREAAKAYGVKFTESWRFKASPALEHDVKVLTVHYCKKYNVDPYLVLASLLKETNLNPNAVGDQGKSKGIGQLKDSLRKDLGKIKKGSVKITDPFDLAQGIEGTVRNFALIHEELPPEKRTLFRELASHNQGHTGGKDFGNMAGNIYANDAYRIYLELKKNGALKGYLG
ncbi:MAG: hypothetical protein V1494_00025 [Candidatus Diapherotrites archaeon]